MRRALGRRGHVEASYLKHFFLTPTKNLRNDGAGRRGRGLLSARTHPGTRESGRCAARAPRAFPVPRAAAALPLERSYTVYGGLMKTHESPRAGGRA